MPRFMIDIFVGDINLGNTRNSGAALRKKKVFLSINLPTLNYPFEANTLLEITSILDNNVLISIIEKIQAFQRYLLN